MKPSNTWILDEERVKRCRVCGLVKKLTDFHRNLLNDDGRHDECRRCRQLYYRRVYTPLAQQLAHLSADDIETEVVRRQQAALAMDEAA